MEGDRDVLYVIGTKEHLFTPNLVGDFKVGKSTLRSLEQRFRSIQTGNPSHLTIYVKIPFKCWDRGGGLALQGISRWRACA